MLKPWMVDLGYSVKQIAFMVGIYGTGCGAVGAFAAGFIIKKLGNRNCLIIFSLYNCCAAAFFLFIAGTGTTLTNLYIAITMLWSAYAMSSVVIYTIAMYKVRKGHEGTDYSIQIVVSQLMGIILAILAGKTADAFGMSGLFAAETLLAAGVFILVFSLAAKVTRNDEPVL